MTQRYDETFKATNYYVLSGIKLPLSRSQFPVSQGYACAWSTMPVFSPCGVPSFRWLGWSQLSSKPIKNIPAFSGKFRR